VCAVACVEDTNEGGPVPCSGGTALTRNCVCTRACVFMGCRLRERTCRKLTRCLAEQLVNLVKLLRMDHSQK